LEEVFFIGALVYTHYYYLHIALVAMQSATKMNNFIPSGKLCEALVIIVFNLTFYTTAEQILLT
jgi:hypothetical protein